MHIGFDDTDSTRKGCTTYLAALLVAKLQKIGAQFLDYPYLIRLNPNVPWKTRGNGALCLRIEHEPEAENQIKQCTIQIVEEYSDLEWKGTDPGIVFFSQKQIPNQLTAYSKRCLTGIVTLKEAHELIKQFKAEAHGYKTQRGIIGALAAIGETLQEDHTYELITYRCPENLTSKRRVNNDSIFKMDQALQPYTFNNVDLPKNRVIITPRGPDPILFGIRGETPQIVKQAFDMVKPLEPVERWMIFKSNQGTDAHLTRVKSLNQAQPYSSIIAQGTVSKNPKNIPLRHIVFSIKDQTAEVDCAAYEPTGELKKIASKLIVGDQIEVCGAVRKPTKDKPLTVNLEKIFIQKLFPKITYQNPLCNTCGKRLKSMGKNQGFRCEKCKTKTITTKNVVETARELKPGLYITSPRSQRHLTKPFRRYGMEKHQQATNKMVDPWHSS
jgi:tRNA(Ile2)-agmatinylcytidine synthase